MWIESARQNFKYEGILTTWSKFLRSISMFRLRMSSVCNPTSVMYRPLELEGAKMSLYKVAVWHLLTPRAIRLIHMIKSF